MPHDHVVVGRLSSCAHSIFCIATLSFHIQYSVHCHQAKSEDICSFLGQTTQASAMETLMAAATHRVTWI